MVAPTARFDPTASCSTDSTDRALDRYLNNDKWTCICSINNKMHATRAMRIFPWSNLHSISTASGVGNNLETIWNGNALR